MSHAVAVGVHGATSSASVVSTAAEASPLLRLVDIPGKGRGYVAVRGCRSGTLLLKDRALVASSGTEMTMMLLRDEHAEVRKSLHHSPRYAQLPCAPLPKQLTNCVPMDEWRRVCSQVTRNAWKLTPGMVIFPHISFFNHACCPNAVAALLSGEVYATRDLKKDEEVCVSYSHVRSYAPTNLRRQMLDGAWEFHCTCSRCEDAISDHAISSAKQEIKLGSILDKKAARWCHAMSNLGINFTDAMVVVRRTTETKADGDDVDGLHSSLRTMPVEVFEMLQNQGSDCLFNEDHWAVHAARYQYLLFFHDLVERVDPAIYAGRNLARLQQHFLALLKTHLTCNARILTAYHLAKHHTLVHLSFVAFQMLRIPVQQFMAVVVAADDNYKADSLLWRVFGRSCHGCLKIGAHSKVCSRCHVAYYCSVECQRVDWPQLHKSLCAPKAVSATPSASSSSSSSSSSSAASSDGSPLTTSVTSSTSSPSLHHAIPSSAESVSVAASAACAGVGAIIIHEDGQDEEEDEASYPPGVLTHFADREEWLDRYACDSDPPHTEWHPVIEHAECRHADLLSVGRVVSDADMTPKWMWRHQTFSVGLTSYGDGWMAIQGIDTNTILDHTAGMELYQKLRAKPYCPREHWTEINHGKSCNRKDCCGNKTVA